MLSIAASIFVVSISESKGVGLIFMFGMATLAFMIWPLHITHFLTLKHRRVDEPRFRSKFGSFYNGIKTSSFATLLYEAIFAVRRFDIVIINLILSVGSPLSGATRNYYLEKVLLLHHI